MGKRALKQQFWNNNSVEVKLIFTDKINIFELLQPYRWPRRDAPAHVFSIGRWGRSFEGAHTISPWSNAAQQRWETGHRNQMRIRRALRNGLGVCAQLMLVNYLYHICCFLTFFPFLRFCIYIKKYVYKYKYFIFINENATQLVTNVIFNLPRTLV